MPVLVGIILVLALGYWIFAYFGRRRRNGYLSVTEYWVYMPHERLPKQDEIMSLVMQGNSPVGPAEGLLFSDIRLHIALVLRSKNPQVFRPDVIADHGEPTAEILSALARSKAVAKVRYLSEIRLKTDSHLQLLPYLAYAYSKLGDGLAIFDVSAEKLMLVSDLQGMLKLDRNARRSDLHLSIVWQPSEQGGRVESRGLIKKGMPELVTDDVMSDERMLVTQLVEEAAKRLWEMDDFPNEIEVETYGDRFRLEFSPPDHGKSQVRIMRYQTQ